MFKDNSLTHPISEADLLVVDALFRRIAERGRKVRAQAIENKEQTEKLPKNIQPTKDDQNTKQVGK